MQYCLDAGRPVSKQAGNEERRQGARDKGPEEGREGGICFDWIHLQTIRPEWSNDFNEMLPLKPDDEYKKRAAPFNWIDDI